MKLIIAFFLFTSILCAQDSSCSNTRFVMNLQNQIDSNLKKQIDQLISDAGTDPYRLSMAIIAVSVQGDEIQYKLMLNKIQEALNLSQAYANPSKTKDSIDAYINQSKKSFAYLAWLLGRILFSADAMQDHDTASKTATMMQFILENKQTEQNEFTAWAWGYLTMHYACSLDFSIYKDKFKQNMNHLIKNISSKNDTVNAIWGLILELQSAALAQDRFFYDQIITSINEISKTHSVIQALNYIPSNDYRAWALSLLRLAAARMRDASLYIRLEAPIRENLIIENQNENKTLAILFNLLSLKQAQMVF